MAVRSGTYEKHFSGDVEYSSFVPAGLPPNPPIELDSETVALLVNANKQLMHLEMISSQIPDVDLFVAMYVRKEALMSSQIEGTQATLEDVLDPTIDSNVNLDVGEVINYVKAINYSIDRLCELPISNRLIREAHAILMTGSRGYGKSPGEFRRSQNWLGGIGSTINTASYIPPAPPEMDIAMSDLEKYINSDGQEDLLIKAGLIHYQFDTIHPFLDGNGRIGRLLIVLFLISKGALTNPVLYISYYLKMNRLEYYDRLTEVRHNDNYEQWIRFFLRAVYESSREAAETIKKLSELHENNSIMIQSLGRSRKTALKLLKYIEANPIIEIGRTSNSLDLSYNTVAAAVMNFVKLGILKQVMPDGKSRARNRTFLYSDYLELLREGT